MVAPRGDALARPVVGATLPVHRQHDAAQILIGLALQGDAAYDDAFAHLQRLSQFNGETSAAQVASFKLGELPFEQGQYQLSARHWQRFLNDMPQSPLARRAAYLLGLSWVARRPEDRGAWSLLPAPGLRLSFCPTCPKTLSSDPKTPAP